MSNAFSIDRNHLNGKVNPIYDLFLQYSHLMVIMRAMATTVTRCQLRADISFATSSGAPGFSGRLLDVLHDLIVSHDQLIKSKA